MTGLEVLVKIKEAEKELDRFNLSVAEWRMQNGLTPQLIELYKAMGKLSSALINARKIADLSKLVESLDSKEA